MRTVRTLLAVILVLAITVPIPTLAQQPSFSRVAGQFVAANYNNWQARVVSGNSSTGAGAVIVVSPASAMSDGRVLAMFNVNAPILVDYGASSETVTPTAVSFGQCPAGGNVSAAGQCATITGSFTYSHGQGSIVTSGTAGLQEAINDAAGLAPGGTVPASGAGGAVLVDRLWPGTTAMLTAASPFSSVSITDLRGPSPVYYYVQPTTLTALATPATRSAAAGTTQVIDGTAVGTWANAANYFCVTYVDMLGGESPCSASFTYSPAGSLATNWASPAASTGAVGWRAYGGITGTSTQYQIPITATTCTLTTLETVFNACAIGSAAVFAGPVTTTSLAPGYTIAVYRPNTQSHTTFGYVASAHVSPGPFQNHYGPFIATGNVAAASIAVLGTVPLPSAYLNQIGKTIRISGKITLTAVNTATPTLTISLGPTFSTGTPTAICLMAETTALTGAVYNAAFSCTLTTNATGASGTVMPGGVLFVQIGAATTAGPMAVDTGVAAITNALNGQVSIYVLLTATTAAINPAQLLDLHVESLN